MENTNKTTNKKADIIIGVVEEINQLKKNGEIQFVNYKWDEKNNTFDVHITPKQTVKHINIDLILTPSGVTFN